MADTISGFITAILNFGSQPTSGKVDRVIQVGHGRKYGDIEVGIAALSLTVQKVISAFG